MASPRVAATVAVFAGRLRRRRSEAHGATQHESEQLHAGLDDDSLSDENAIPFRHLAGSNFFRSLALIDLAEAMLKRAFGDQYIAVRVNAAGQGDFFQVHVDTEHVEVEEVKRFIVTAFYQRFGLSPETKFVELHSGAGAVGLRLSRFDQLQKFAADLRALTQAVPT